MIKEEHRWMYNYILIHVSRTWERIRMAQPFEEMTQDNIESAEDGIPHVADMIFDNVIIQGFLNASEGVKQDDYWDKNTGTMSDWYIEQVAHNYIMQNYTHPVG